ncbi:MAG: aldehyde dehydrogenase [Cryomorphaceae bacterium]|nr:aldehyde dehydrogenase [Flavobacteriales bacterium]
MTEILNFIDGRFSAADSGLWLDNIDPSTGKVYSKIARSGASDADRAVKAAKAAFPAWSKLPASERFSHIMRLADGIRQKSEAFAKAESVDNGKPVSLARAVDIPRAVSNFEFYAAAAMHYASSSHYTEGVGINYTLRRPIGVAACISPWNLPLYLFSWKIAPALAAGNTVVAKPSEITPMTAYMLAETAREINFPKGVLNIIHGLGGEAGEPICTHPDVGAISFTGGTETGKRIISQAGMQFKKLSLELGGKNPNIIFADCDFDKMLSTTVRSSFANQGQICLCGSRILVEKSIYKRFREAFTAKVKELEVGNPASESTRMGAVVSEGHMKKILSYIDLAQQEGGRILCGGNRVKLEGELSGGYYVAPTVIEGLDQQCRTNQEEIFGPVVTLDTFETDEEAVAKANATPYGLASTIWTSDLNRAHRTAEAVHAGIVWVNCWLERDLRTPFGGVKNSGVGREGGFEAMNFFTEPKNVCIAYNQ